MSSGNPNRESDGDNQRAQPRVSEREVAIWNDSTHQDVDGEILYFFRVSFELEYNRGLIFGKLEHFYSDLDIRSYVAYETLGDYDLLVRAWVPRRYIAAEIVASLRDSLSNVGRLEVQFLQCESIYHWAGADDRTTAPPAGPVVPTPAASVHMVEGVNEYNAEQYAGFRSDRDSRDRGAELEVRETLSRPTFVDDLVRAGLLSTVSLEARGVRFYITFDHAWRADAATNTDVLETIREKCRDVERAWTGKYGTDLKPRISIYAGNGTMSDFVVLARAPHGYFHEFVSSLTGGLRSIGLDRRYRMRPYTFVIADEMFADFSEYRRATTADVAPDVLVLKDESETLEFKTTFSLNFRTLWRDGELRTESFLRDAIVRAVCGFLNSPRGGDLVIGVLEVEREFVKAQTEGSRLIEWLAQRYDYKATRDENDEYLRPFPNLVVGVNQEYSADAKYDSFDLYQGAIRDTLRSYLEPDPGAWIQLEHHDIGDRRVIIISVRPANVWAYAADTKRTKMAFYVREAGATQEYLGYNADLYRRAHPRSE